MKTLDGSRILHSDKRVKTSIYNRARGHRPVTRFYTGFRRFGAFVAFLAMLAATFYSASSASVSVKPARHPAGNASTTTAMNRAVVGKSARGMNAMDARAGTNHNNTFLPAASWLSLAPLMPQAAPSESIALYASDCSTPKTSFVLGETVCAVVTGAPFGSEVQRQITWVGPDGIIMTAAAVTTDPQSNSFTISTSATTTSGDSTLNNRGTWTVASIASSDASVQAETSFTVSDPQNAATDLSIAVNKIGAFSAPAGGSVSFTIEVANNGPDAAANVEIRNPVPADTTFLSITQNSGPTFTCVDPGAGNMGTTLCSIAGLSKDDTASFTVVYEVAPATPRDTMISNSATIANNVAELRNSDNSGADVATVGPATCVLNCPDNVTMGNDQDAFGAVVTFSDPTSTGSCDSVESAPASGSFFPVGTTTVTGSASNGNPCSFTVTINDTQAPVISCPDDISAFESTPGSGSAVVNYAPPSVTENDPAGAPVTCDHPSGSSFPVGTTLVTCTATDAATNSASCSFNVTVEADASACTLDCPDDITVDADAGSCGAVVNYPAATASEACGTVSYSKASGTVFPVGTTTVTVTTTAGRGCRFRVTVRDTQAPTISCPANITANAAANACQAVVNPGTATATDNCPMGLTVKGVRDDGDPLNAAYPIGKTIITWTATDKSGNTTSCEQTVTVKDTVAPTVTLVPTINVTAPADSCLVEVPEVLALQTNGEGNYGTATDNCAGPDRLTIIQTPAAGTFVGSGNHLITVTVYDGDPFDPDAPTPNSTTRTTNLHVTDGTPPVITLNGANPITVECHTSFTDPGATATDSCAGSFPATASGTVNVNTPGTYTITYTASDPGGNAATPVTRTVKVVDTIAPTITLNGQTITLWPPNHQYIAVNVTSLVASASDGCDSGVNLNSVYISKVTSDETENGNGDGNTNNDIIIAANCKSVQLRSERQGGGNGRVYTITFKVKDAAGNATTATAKVKVPKSQGNNGGAVDDGPQYTVTSNCP
ncbi:MAG: HYR domain-containing protein [Pyrinomonadaceae bacterium]